MQLFLKICSSEKEVFKAAKVESGDRHAASSWLLD